MSTNGQNETNLPAVGSTTRFRRWHVVIVLIAVTGGAIALWRAEPDPSPEPQKPQRATKHVTVDDSDLDPLSVLANPGYVGPQVCGECHVPRLTEFKHTRHFGACRAPEAGSMPPGFKGDTAQLASRYPGLRFEMAPTSGAYHQSVVRDSPAGEKRLTSRIDLIYGSGGKADEVFFTWRDERLFELQAAWLHPSKEWGEQPFNPHDEGDLLRTTTSRCIECHNTWIGHVRGTENQYKRESFIAGVTCEKCHGPGREHVEFHRKHPDQREAHAVVHPGHLSRERQMALCAQCHSNSMRPRQPAFSYRPGQPLDSCFRTLTADGPENDHVADQVKYLRRSKCFEKSDTLSCTSCHNPHRATETTAVHASCLKCHKPIDCREQPRLPKAVQDKCVSCHMPQFNRVEVNFHTKDDRYVFPVRPHNHRIAVYPAATREVLLDWYRAQPDAPSHQKAEELARMLVEHWLGEAEKLGKAYRYLAAVGAIREALRINPTPAVKAKLKEVADIRDKLDADWYLASRHYNARKYSDAIDVLENILKVKPDHAQAHGKLGTLYEMVGQNDKAVEHLQAVAKCDPDDAHGYNMLGWLAYLKGRGSEAADWFRRADEIQPFSAEINYRWGLALLSLEKWPEGAARFRQVLLIDPTHPGGCQGLSHALRRQGRTDEALIFARRAARLTRMENVDILLSLADAYADASRWAEAADVASQAMEVARISNPNLLPLIERRYDELIARAR
jgi:tetratricopeptide (TPR) repeat protein